GDDLRVELRYHLDHHVTRLRDAVRHARAHVDDRGVHPDHEAVDTPEKVLVVLPRLERMRAFAGADHCELARQAAADLVHGYEMPGLAQALHAGFDVELEDVARDALVLREPGRLDSSHGGEIP